MLFAYLVKHKKKALIFAGIIFCCFFVLLFFPKQKLYTDNKGKDQELVDILRRQEQASATSSSEDLEIFKVEHVIDGDTFVVDVGDGRATIRLLGINTPETVDPRKPVECFGPEASARGHQLLDGKTVELILDPSQDALDMYGRVLAYAYVQQDRNQDKSIFYNKEMIEEGFAYEYTFKTAYFYQKEFKDMQENAKDAGLGLWSDKTCNGEKQPGQS